MYCDWKLGSSVVVHDPEKLMYLVLRHNPIGSVERNFQFQFHSLFLSYVDLSECHLASVPRGLPASIRYLQLRRNNMTSVRRSSFRDCPFAVSYTHLTLPTILRV